MVLPLAWVVLGFSPRPAAALPTFEHPFLIRREETWGFCSAELLRVGDVLVTRSTLAADAAVPLRWPKGDYISPLATDPRHFYRAVVHQVLVSRNQAHRWHHER